MEWLFNDPPNVAVLTTDKIMNKLKPILHVTHDDDDGMWQFHDGDEVKEEDARILSLRQIVEIDPSIMELHNLPIGWKANRKETKSDWIRSKNNENSD